MAKPIVFVLGASGKVGSATVAALSAKFGDEFQVRAGVRDTTTESAKSLATMKGVEVVEAKMGSPQLASTLSGVSLLFIVTPPTKDCAELVGDSTKAGKESGVKFILTLSGQTATGPGIFGQQYGDLEKNVQSSGVAFCIVRLSMFFDNIPYYVKTVKSASQLEDCCDGQKKFINVAASDIGKACAAILGSWEKHAGQTYLLATAIFSCEDLAKELSSVLGKELKFVRKEYDVARQEFLDMHWPEWQADGVLELARLIDDESPLMTSADLTLFKQLTGEDPLSLAAFLASCVDQFQ